MYRRTKLLVQASFLLFGALFKRSWPCTEDVRSIQDREEGTVMPSQSPQALLVGGTRLQIALQWVLLYQDFPGWTEDFTISLSWELPAKFHWIYLHWFTLWLGSSNQLICIIYKKLQNGLLIILPWYWMAMILICKCTEFQLHTEVLENPLPDCHWRFHWGLTRKYGCSVSLWVFHPWICSQNALVLSVQWIDAFRLSDLCSFLSANPSLW